MSGADTKIKEFLEIELNAFKDMHGTQTSTLLELVVLNMSFLSMIKKCALDTEVNKIEMAAFTELHAVKCLEIAAEMANISAENIDIALTKGLELVDCTQAIADPTHTNLH